MHLKIVISFKYILFQPCFGLGCIVTAGALVWLAFLNNTSAMQVFGAAILIGIGSTTLLVTSLSMIADVIGHHTVRFICLLCRYCNLLNYLIIVLQSSSAFVYGVMSFGDKLSSGIVLMFVQALEPVCAPKM